MMWDILLALIPSMLIHAVVYSGVGIAMFWLLRRFDVFHGARGLKPVVFGAIAGLTISFLMSFDLFMKAEQGQILSKTIAARTAKADPEKAAANALALKGDFLKAIDFLSSNPDQLTVQSKTKLFEQFQPLFPKGIEDVRTYYQNIHSAIECQLSLYEDVQATMKSKTSTTSAKTKSCEEIPGEFFNRPKLLSAETLDANRAMKERILRGGKGSANEPKLTEKEVSLLVEQHHAKLENLQKIFQ